MTAPVFSCSRLTVRQRQARDAPPVVRSLSYEVSAGECVALCGPSGSGKTTASLAPFGLTGTELAVEGSATFAGNDALTRVGKAGAGGVAFVFQEPISNFSPHLKIKLQLYDLTEENTKSKMTEWAGMLGLRDFPRLLEQLPAQCSGGELQRLALLAALLQGPRLLVADEPTAALDATGRAAWATLVRQRLDRGLGLLLITHDEALLQALANRQIVLAPGANEPDFPSAGANKKISTQHAALLSVQWPAGSHPTVHDADDIGHRADACPGSGNGNGNGFSLAAGQCLALTGPSGAGKSSLLQLALGLPSPVRGEVTWNGRRLDPWPSVTRRRLAGRMAAVLQDARSGLSPHRQVEGIVAAAFRGSGHPWRSCRQLAAAELDALQVPPQTWRQRPLTLSVGQAQRVALATAMAVRPALLVCDEPTAAQDAGHRALVIRRLLQARDRDGCAVLLATHDLELARALGGRRLTVLGAGAGSGPG